MDHHRELWVEQFPGSRITDFTFSFRGDSGEGKITVSYNGKVIDPTFIGLVPVVEENGK